MSVSEQAENELKTAFAKALLSSPDDPFKAAFSVISNNSKACEAATYWTNDAFVKSEKIRLLDEHGLKAFLPTKEQQAKDIYEMATDTRLDEEIRLKAHELYAKLMGHIEKPDNSTKIILNQTVMTVPVCATDEEWEKRAQKQQHVLIHGDASAAN